ncbi:aminotransferase class V-fold PLP-dependent enzyme [bacterium]|nr:aminotransferase class V-fold PLP-dependent enzyme [bacterium]
MGYSFRRLQDSTTIPVIAPNYGAFEELERGVTAALETYSNVHRGTGHYSMVSTALFEETRTIIIKYLGLKKNKYVVVYCTVRGSEKLKTHLKFNTYQMISSRDVGLPLGLRVLVIKKNALPKGLPFQTGGDVVKIVSPHSVIWADAPHKFEAGTPRIINIIAFAIALKVKSRYGNDCFNAQENAETSANNILYEDELTGISGLELLAVLRMRIVGRGLLVPTTGGEKSYINFDNSASTPTFFPIWDAVRKIWKQPEKTRTDIVREVKRILSGFLGASMETYETVFTCNATEALNIAAEMLQTEDDDGSDLVILNTLLEHNSNELPWRYIPGASLIRFPVDDEGFVNPDELENILRQYNQEFVFGKKRIRLIAISGASNVLGSINDIKEISKIAHKYKTRVLVDAAQLVAHRRIDMEKWDIDYLTFAGHKVYAPFGSGALIVKKELISFNASDLKRVKDSGEENVIGIAALGKAIVLLQRVGMDVIESREKKLIRRLLKGLSGLQTIDIFGINDPDSKRFQQKGGVVSFSFKGVPHNLAAKELADYEGIGVRHGCFCAHLLVKHLLKIHPLRAFSADVSLTLMPKFTSVILPGLVRVSFGLENEESEIDRLIKGLERIEKAPRSAINRLLAFTDNGTPLLPCTGVKRQMDEFLETRIKKVYSIHSDIQIQRHAEALELSHSQ